MQSNAQVANIQVAQNRPTIGKQLTVTARHNLAALAVSLRDES